MRSTTRQLYPYSLSYLPGERGGKWHNVYIKASIHKTTCCFNKICNNFLYIIGQRSKVAGNRSVRCCPNCQMLTVKCCTQSNPISRTWGHLRNKFLQLKFLHAIPEIRTHGQFNCPTYVLKRREVPLYWWRLRLILVVQFLCGDASFTRNPSALTRRLVWQSYRWEQCLLQRQRWWSECLQWSHWTPPETEREGEGGGGVSPSSGPRLQDTLDKFSREKTWCSSGRGKSPPGTSILKTNIFCSLHREEQTNFEETNSKISIIAPLRRREGESS